MGTERLIAIIDDEASLRETLTLALSREGYAVRAFDGGATALAALVDSPPDAIILDIAMPGMDGIEFCEHYRVLQPRTPIIFLSACAEEDTRLEALERGGDDFLAKPYSLAELSTRLKVCFLRQRRLGLSPYTMDEGTQVEHKAQSRTGTRRLRLDVEAWEACLDDMRLDLTVTEYRLLSALAAGPGRAYTRERLAEACYPDDFYVADRNVDAHIKRLRRKLRAVAADFDALETVHGVGYRLREGSVEP